MKPLISILSGVLCFAVGLGAAQQPAPATTASIDVQALGPQVGDKVPDFSLPDQRGNARTLASLMGPKGLMLLFYRSADWCPYCKTQLVEEQSSYPTLVRDGYGFAAISYDPVPTLADFAGRRGITYPLLSDKGSVIIRKYGILNTTVPESNTQIFGIPFPGTFVLDRRGVVTARFFEDGYQERNTLSSIMVKVGGDIGVPATKIEAPHLAITAYTTDQVAAPGTHFSLVLDLAPQGGVHVYAPEVTGYKPVRLTVKPQTALIVRGAQYPASEDYFFAPLNEHVPVYQKPFRIVQDVMIDPSPQAASALASRADLTIEATLDYQACDDKVCFNPQSLPLSWTIALKALDRERATAR